MTLPVVLLPGSMCDAALFAGQLEALGATASIGDLTRSSSIEAMAVDVLDDAPPVFAVAGLSLGGIVAAEVAVQAPERVAGVALLDTNLGLADEVQQQNRQLWGELVRAGHFEQIIKTVDHLTIDADAHGRAIIEMASRVGPEAFVRQNEALLYRRDRRGDLGSLNCPVLIVCGREDELCPPAMHRDIANRIPHARLEIVDRAGHLSTIDQPEELTRLLTQWLNLCTTNQPMKGTAHEYNQV